MRGAKRRYYRLGAVSYSLRSSLSLWLSRLRENCPAGSYCPEGSSAPINCPSGTFSDAVNAANISTCVDTAPGWYTLGGEGVRGRVYGTSTFLSGNEFRKACVTPLLPTPPPFLTPLSLVAGAKSSTTSPCPAGYYCPQRTGVYTNFPCPEGTYSATTGLYTSGQCLNCTLGNYCPLASTAVTACAVGKYQQYTAATASSACQSCEPGWACPTTGMWTMTTRCDTGHYCPHGTSYPSQYPCPLGSYTDQINLTVASECNACPPRFACSQADGTISGTIELCAQGHYCPQSTPSPTSFDCPPGTYSNRTDLEDPSECTDCPPGFYCAGGSATFSGNCAQGHYCPMNTITR